jgi:molybdate transport system ATP-binding protein
MSVDESFRGMQDPWLHAMVHHRQGSQLLAVEIALCAPLTVLVGASGSGKTSLLRAISGLLRPQRGRITLGDFTVWDSHTHVWLPPGRRGCGMVMQRPALFPAMTAGENIAFGLHALPAPVRRQRLDEMVSLFRLENFVHRHATALSGGEQQRVALARAIAPHPRVLLLDEPFAGLNPDLKAEILTGLETWLTHRQTPVLHVTHDVAEAWRLCARSETEVLRMEAGRIVAQGAAAAVLATDRERLQAALQ